MSVAGEGARWWARGGAGMAGGALIAVAAALLALAAASGPLFVSSAGTELLRRELEGPGVPTLIELSSSGQPTAGTLRRADEAVRERAAEAGLPEPVVSVSLGNVSVPDWTDPLLGGPAVQVIGIDGGLAALPPAVAEADGGFAVTAQDADRLGIEAGDTVEVRGQTGSAEVRVGTIVEDIPRGEVPDAWRPFGSLIHYSLEPGVDPSYPDPTPPTLLAEADEMLDVLAGLSPEDARADRRESASAAWRVPLPDEPISLELARELSDPVEELRAEAVNPSSELAGALASGPLAPPHARALLEDALARAEQANAALVGPIGALALGGQGLGLLGIAAATAVGGRRRIQRARLWAARGVSPVVLGLRGALASAPAVLCGAAAGTAGAWALVTWLGPGGAVDSRALAAGARASALGAGAAIALIGVVLTAASAAATRVTGAPRRLPPIAEATAAVLAGVALWQLRDGGGVVAISADGSAQLDLLGLALPLLIVVAVAGLGARFVRLLLGLSARGIRRRAPSLHLASRRLGALTPATTGVVALAAAAIGAVTLSSTLVESSQRTIDEKSGLLVGAQVSARLPRPEATREAMDLEAVPGASTVVFRAEEALLDDRAEVDVLAVTPEDAAAVGYRPHGFDQAAFEELLAGIEPGSGEPLPALLAHPSMSAPRGPTSVAFEGHEVGVEVVERVDAFPGMTADRPLLVVGDPGALGSEDPQVAARLASTVDPYLWVTGAPDEEEARVALERAGVDHQRIALASELRDDPGLAALDWTLGFLRGQATALGALGLLVLLASFIARQRQRALPTALAGRMGLRPRARAAADAIELACLLGAALALGVGAGLSAARVTLGQYDPVPALALPPILDVPTASLGALLGAGLVGGAVTLARASRTVAGADIPHLLRRG